MPATLAAVWTEISSYFTTALDGAITVITAIPLLCAPLVVFVASKVLGQAKSLFKSGGRRR